jgi:DeoR family suf operon transcriptional repressor
MQETRRQILDVLKTEGMCTVDELVQALRQLRGDKITAVTVRHHLSILQADGFVDTPEMRHRSTPGRPQHVYALTEQGLAQFPTNYQRLATGLLERMRQHIQGDVVNVIIEGVADDMAQEANIPVGSVQERLEAVVSYLSDHGYDANWEPADKALLEESIGEQKQGFVLYMHNCPYHHIAHGEDTLCHLDMRMISKMLGVVPRLLSRVVDGGQTCAYLIPDKTKPL